MAEQATPTYDLPADMAALAGVEPAEEKTGAAGEAPTTATETKTADESADTVAGAQANDATKTDEPAKNPEPEKVVEPVKEPEKPAEPAAPDPAQAQAEAARQKELDDLQRDSQELFRLFDKPTNDGGFDPLNETHALLAIKTLAKQNEILRQAITEDRAKTRGIEEKVSAKDKWERWGDDNPHIGTKKGQQMMAEEIDRASKKFPDRQIALAVALDRWEERVSAIKKVPDPPPPPPAAPTKKPNVAIVPKGGTPSKIPVEELQGLTVTQKRERGYYRNM